MKYVMVENSRVVNILETDDAASLRPIPGQTLFECGDVDIRIGDLFLDGAVYRNMSSICLDLSSVLDAVVVPIWAEFDDESAFVPGCKVRYLGSVYRCIAEHTKSADPKPTNETFWELA